MKFTFPTIVSYSALALELVYIHFTEIKLFLNRPFYSRVKCNQAFE